MVRREVRPAKYDFSERQYKTQLKHLEPRAHEKNCVCGTCWMRAVRCAVYSWMDGRVPKSTVRMKEVLIWHCNTSIPSLPLCTVLTRQTLVTVCADMTTWMFGSSTKVLSRFGKQAASKFQSVRASVKSYVGHTKHEHMGRWGSLGAGTCDAFESALRSSREWASHIVTIVCCLGCHLFWPLAAPQQKSKLAFPHPAQAQTSSALSPPSRSFYSSPRMNREKRHRVTSPSRSLNVVLFDNSSSGLCSLEALKLGLTRHTHSWRPLRPDTCVSFFCASQIVPVPDLSPLAYHRTQLVRLWAPFVCIQPPLSLLLQLASSMGLVRRWRNFPRHKVFRLFLPSPHEHTIAASVLHVHSPCTHHKRLQQPQSSETVCADMTTWMFGSSTKVLSRVSSPSRRISWGWGSFAQHVTPLSSLIPSSTHDKLFVPPRDPIAALDKAPESALKVSTGVGSRHCGSKAAMACDRVVPDLMLPLWEEVLWPFLDAWDSVRLRTTSTHWNVPGRCGPHGELLLPLMQKKPTFVPDSEAFNSFIGDGFLVPELKDESEASKDEQADSSSENNVANGALFVIGRHWSGDTIALVLQDWEVAKVALSCHIAWTCWCQELHEVEKRRGWFGFWARLFVEAKEVNDRSFWVELAGKFPSNFVSMNIVAVCDEGLSLTVWATVFRVNSWWGEMARASFAGTWGWGRFDVLKLFLARLFYFFKPQTHQHMWRFFGDMEHRRLRL